MSSYSPRPVTQYGVQVVNGWPTKIYGLAVEGEPGEELLDAARAAAVASLPAPAAAAAAGGGAAFVIAHRARPACFVLVYWWATPVDLRLAYFRSPLDRPAELSPMPQYSTGCVWELALTNHERAAWVEHVLGNVPSLDAYLAAGVPSEI